jgi:signal transduction histidine kinase
VVSSEELLEHVWDANADPFTQTVRVTVGTLRRKLGEGSIETVVGRGYRLREAVMSAPSLPVDPVPAHGALLHAAVRAGRRALAITYFAVASTTDRSRSPSGPPRSTRTAVRRHHHVAEVSEIEAAVNYNTLQNLRTYSLIALAACSSPASASAGCSPAGRCARSARSPDRPRDPGHRPVPAHPPAGPHDELRDLADTDRLHAGPAGPRVPGQRQLIDDASHELRSPLAIIRTNLDASLTDPVASADARPARRRRRPRHPRMSRLVEDLLATARRDADAAGRHRHRLDVLAGEAGEEFAPGFLPVRPQHGPAHHRRP